MKKYWGIVSKIKLLPSPWKSWELGYIPIHRLQLLWIGSTDFTQPFQKWNNSTFPTNDYICNTSFFFLFLLFILILVISVFSFCFSGVAQGLLILFFSKIQILILLNFLYFLNLYYISDFYISIISFHIPCRFNLIFFKFS